MTRRGGDYTGKMRKYIRMTVGFKKYWFKIEFEELLDASLSDVDLELWIGQTREHRNSTRLLSTYEAHYAKADFVWLYSKRDQGENGLISVDECAQIGWPTYMITYRSNTGKLLKPGVIVTKEQVKRQEWNFKEILSRWDLFFFCFWLDQF